MLITYWDNGRQDVGRNQFRAYTNTISSLFIGAAYYLELLQSTSNAEPLPQSGAVLARQKFRASLKSL